MNNIVFNGGMILSSYVFKMIFTNLYANNKILIYHIIVYASDSMVI